MIVQHTNNISPAAQPASNVEPAHGAAVKLPENANKQQPSPEQLKAAVDNINQTLRQSNQNLEFEFSLDTGTKKPIVKVTNTQTGELIRQIPSEEMLAVTRSIDQFQKGLLLKQEA